MIRTVKTENGWIRGIEAADPRITAFKGVPFAAPPVGENRWRAPQPCEDWEGVRDAFRFAPIAVQDTPGLGDDIYCREWHVDPDIDMDEDCLYLNVWTGARSAGEKQPVLVWFYGGALQWGYPAEMEFDGERLARRGVVVVTVNYRINVFGFMAHPQITLGQPEAPANFGCLDQQAGLKWVIRNIAAFGGDPDNITIAGQSAGGGSVLAQMACPDSEGLFQRAVIMSAMIRNPYDKDFMKEPEPLWQAEEKGQDFFGFLGVDTLEEARKLDALYIRDKYAEYAKTCPRMGIVQDGRFCTGSPLRLFLEGKGADVPVMAGNTEDEFPGFLTAASEEELRRRAQNIFGDSAEEFLRLPEALTAAGEGHYGRVNGTECAIKGIFGRKKERGSRQDYYYYRFAADIPGWDCPGTFHSVDLWFFFETLAKCWRPFRGKHYDLARQMCNYWVNFIKTGDPNGLDADQSPMPQWFPYTDENPSEMVFETAGPVCVMRREESPFIRFLSREILKQIQKEPDWAEVMRPVWQDGNMYRETFAMVEEDGVCAAPFLFLPQGPVRVESYDGESVYEEGRDYRVEYDRLVLTDDSRIPRTGWERFFFRTEEEVRKALEEAGIQLDFGPVETVDGTYLNLCAIGNPTLVTDMQTAVTYRTGERWQGYVPEEEMESLPGLREKLGRKEPLRIVLYGDSISCGFDCSGKYGLKPGQPVWPALLLQQMERKWKVPVCFHNTSVSGKDTEWAIQHAGERVSIYRPDLVILGFGMNDRCDGQQYRELTGRLMAAVRQECPAAEFVLIATTLPNQLADTAPLHFWSHQDEYPDSLRELCGEGVVLADVQAVQREIAKRKRYIDLTGNLLNHPNDYLARIQAQVLAAVLGLV